MMFKKIAAAAALVIASSSAFAAQPNTFYAGVDLGKTKIDDASGRETSYGVFAGYNFAPNLAVEANLRRLGEADFYGYEVKAEQFGVSLVGTLPLQNGFNLFGRVGGNRLEAKTRANRVSISDSTTKFMYGVGVGYAFTPAVSARVELQKPASDTTNLSVGVAYQF